MSYILHLNYDFKIDTDLFQFCFKRGNERDGRVKQTVGHVELFMPYGFEFARPKDLLWANKVVAEVLRNHAQIILKPRVFDLAVAHGISINRIAVRNAVSRWGSSSSLGNINLSLWLLLLPAHLVDYIIIHELAHQVELNHSPRFWAQVDKMLGQGPGAAKRIDQEVNDYAKNINWLQV